MRSILYFSLLSQWRARHNLLGALCFALGGVWCIRFILAYGGLGALPVPVWHAFFWVIFLFNAFFLAHKLHALSTEELLADYLRMSALTLLFTRSLSHFFYLFIAGLITSTSALIFWGGILHHPMVFLGVLGLCAFGFSLILSFLTLMLAKIEADCLILPVLALPTLIPLCLSAFKVSMLSAQANNLQVWPSLGLLLAIVCMICAIVLLLFPFVWKS